jgi:hypothetical protein
MKTFWSSLRLRLVPLVGTMISFVALASPSAVHGSLVVVATFSDLADTTMGDDLWSVSYTLSGTTFQVNQGFTIFFPSSQFKNLSTPLSPTGWNVLSVQPDVGLAAPGFLDGLALINSAPLNQPFGLTFDWLDTGPPGAQSFEMYDQTGTFQVISSGQAVVAGPAVPEPGTVGWGICIIGVIALSAGRGRTNRLARR